MIRSYLPFASPIMLIKKKNSTDRLRIDYIVFNENAIADKYLLLLISDQDSRVCGATYFWYIDMASGFYQIPVHPNSIERTAFVKPEEQ